MYEPKNDIQKAFLEGIDEVYRTLLTTDVYLYLLDEEATEVDDVYGETLRKVYKEPYKLTAKINESQPKDEDPDGTVTRSATFKLPTKQFIDLGIPFLTEPDWEVLRKGKLVYEGTEYLIDTVEPVTLISNIWLFLTIRATEVKKSSKVTEPPSEDIPEVSDDPYENE